MKALLGILLGVICVDLLLFLVHRQPLPPVRAASRISTPLNYAAALDRARNLYGPVWRSVPSDSAPNDGPVIWFAPH